MDAALAGRATELGHVTPRVEGDRVYCRCGAEMDAMIGHRIGEGMRRLWWQCSRYASHLTAAIPVPVDPVEP